MEKYRSLLEQYVERYNAGDLEGVMDLYADDAVQRMPDGTFVGRDAITACLSQELIAFPDVHHRFVSYVEQGDAFADEWIFEGTHTGPLGMPDGSELADRQAGGGARDGDRRVLRAGKVIANNLYYDNLAVVGQLGLLPAATTA